MTAEVAVMNKSAIALAADSKVTVSGVGASKTYDTVSKVFTLSKVHPVGIMIFGNAEFMSYPWETIIKLYRKKRGIDSEATIAKWGANFVKFVRAFGKITKEHRTENARQIVRSWAQQVNDEAVNLAIDRKITIPSADFVDLLKNRVQTQIASFMEEDLYFDGDQGVKIAKQHVKDVYLAIKPMFSRYKDDELTKTAAAMGLLALTSIEMSPQMSGFVIAGFGEDEYFPALIEYNTDGYVGPTIKIIQSDGFEVMRDNASCVRAFAQKDMVQQFMNGVDTGFRIVMEQTLSRSMIQTANAVLDKYGLKRNKTDKVRREIEEAVEASNNRLSISISEYLRRNFWLPVVEMIALLPKDELAHLAESLVALTSLKRRVSSGLETVGGAVDVALISKGDGFVWVKRKHYFPAELNPAFIRNYLRGMMGDDDGNGR